MKYFYSISNSDGWSGGLLIYGCCLPCNVAFLIPYQFPNINGRLCVADSKLVIRHDGDRTDATFKSLSNKYQ